MSERPRDDERTDEGYVECEPPPPAPAPNRPRQPEIRFRLGTHGSFLGRMRAAFERPGTAEAEAGAREGAAHLERVRRLPPGNPGLALLDAWATVAHVLAFYQERLANEAYLGTAIEPRSVRELARALGYELPPGVAASTPVVFTVDDAAGAPEEALIPRGTRVQSLPADGQLPQTFETLEPLVARALWNTLRPLAAERLRLRLEDGAPVYENAGGVRVRARQLYLQGTALVLAPGDLLLLAPEPGAPPVVCELRALVPDDAGGGTWAVLAGDPGQAQELPPLAISSFWPRSEDEAAKEEATGAAPGAAAPAERLDQMIEEAVLRQGWYERDLQGFLAKRRWEPRLVERLAATLPRPLPPREPRWAAAPVLQVLRTRAGLHGQEAPAFTYDSKGKPIPVFDGEEPGIWNPSRPGVLNRIHLDAVVPELAAGDWVVLAQRGEADGASLRRAYRIERVSEVRRADWGVSARVSALDLARGAEDPEGERFRLFGTSVYLHGAPLALADPPVLDPVAGQELILDRLVLGLGPGQLLVLTGEREDARGLSHSELAVLESARHARGCTILRFAAPLGQRYVRGTVTLSANVVHATHGETVEEVLGSGGGAARHQRFRLRKPPLTYVPAASAGGAASTLVVRVSGALWRETVALADEGPEAECYQLQHHEGGETEVLFGDGQHGARLPSGQENLSASYRSGIGRSGEVPAERLILLAESPAGIRAVTNPLPATGAADPERMDEARTNAPRTVRTMGRAISLQDFTDLASAFPGIGKAQAQSFREPGRGHLVVHLTVAGVGGAAVEPQSALARALVKALDAARDPTLRRKVELRVASFEPRFFNLKAALRIAPRWTEEPVLAAARAALQGAFSFARRDFAQPLTWAEVIATLHAVPGVLAARVKWPPFEPSRPYVPAPAPSVSATAAERRDDVVVHAARRVQGRILPAQLLLINPAGVLLERWEDLP